MKLKNIADLYNITQDKELADSFVSKCLELGMLEELCDGWYIAHE